MGLGAAGFARVPGSGDQGPGAKRLDGQPSTAQVLMNEGVSFTWESNDGSQMFAHWLQDHYNQGDSIDKYTFASNCSDYRGKVNADIIVSHIQDYIKANGPTSVSPYMFVAIGDDFVAPKPCLLTYIDIWNQQQYGVSATDGDVFVVSATFDHYVDLVKSFTSNDTNKRPLTVRHFEPTPYWTGFYASRPTLKTMQQTAVRLTTAAESLIVLSRTGKAFASDLNHIWAYMTPSTHHDFVTGTAPDPVYQGEQIPYLSEANLAAHILLQTVLNQVASSLTSDATVAEKAYFVYNPLGFLRKVSPLLLPEARDKNHRSFFDGHKYHPIQDTHDGKIVTTIGQLASQTFLVGKLTSKSPTSDTLVRVRVDSDSVIIENSQIRVTLSEGAFWSATSIIDLSTGEELVEPTDEDPGAFNLQILSDAGNIYRFGNEMNGCEFGGSVYKQTALTLNATLVEPGPIRARVVTQVNFTSPSNGQITTITRIYTLYHHDRMIRVEVEGAAPSRTSVFMRTPLSFPSFKASYGTPYHYDTFMPDTYWKGYNFFVVHNFLTLTSPEGHSLGFFSSDLRAWAFDQTTVVTALLRNTPGGQCQGYGADGSDSEVHRVSLALRVPSGLAVAPALSPLTESLEFSTSLQTSSELGRAQSPNSPRVTLFSIAGEAIITSTKPAEADPSKIVLRIYCPAATANNPVSFTINAQGAIKEANPITALERSLPAGENSIKVSGVNGKEASVTMTTALATVLITPGW